VFQKAVEDTVSGHLTLQHLNLLLEHTGCFLELFKIISAVTKDVRWVPQSESPGVDQIHVLQKLIGWRKAEVEEFYWSCSRVQHFLDMCTSIRSGSDFIMLMN
jgi:hypothetical protein